MSTYESLKGLKVKYLSADTSGDRLQEGEIFYNSSDFNLKSHIAVGAWSSSANVLVARYNSGIGGTQTAAFLAGGATPDDSVTDDTYEYDGTGWAVGGDLVGADRLTTGSGTLTAGLVAGGWTGSANSADSEEYNGTSWTEGNNLNTARRYSGHFGIQTAAVLCAGETGVVAATEEYNGTSWSNGNDVNTPKGHIGGSGTLTAGLKCGGAPTSAATEEYDGTNWTSVNNMNTARRADSLFGLQTASIVAGGYTTTQVASTEEYNGTTWAEIADIAAASYYGGGVGSTTSGLYCQGLPANSRTEEWNVSTSTVTGAVWASGANFPVTIQDPAGAGPVTASVVWGGYDGPAYDAETFEYNGTSWSESGDLNTARACYHTGAGSQTAALQASGYATSDHTENSEEYNGTAWTEGNNLNNPRYSATGGGIQTSALICGGNGDPGNSAIANNESYNGTSWSNETALPGTTAGGKQYSGTGETASLIIGFGPAKNDTLSYDGSSWTDLGHHLVEGNTTAAGGSQQGTTTAALIAGGFDPSPSIIAKSQQYNGTTWVTAASLATARRGGGASGTAASCLAVGGETPTQINTVEEFTGETTAVNDAKTIDFD